MADRYWVGGTATWDGTAGTKWAITSGGSGGAAVPTSSDNVYFDLNSGVSTVTVSGSRPCSSFSTFGSVITFTGSGSIEPYGTSVTLDSLTSLGVTLVARNNQTWTLNGAQLSHVTLASTADITCVDGIDSTGDLFFSSGCVLRLAAGEVSTFSSFSSTGTYTLCSTIASTRATMECTGFSGNVAVPTYATITDIAFQDFTVYWGLGCVDGGNNTGIYVRELFCLSRSPL